MSWFSLRVFFIVNFLTAAFPGASLARPAWSEEKSDLTTCDYRHFLASKCNENGSFRKAIFYLIMSKQTLKESKKIKYQNKIRSETDTYTKINEHFFMGFFI